MRKSFLFAIILGSLFIGSCKSTTTKKPKLDLPTNSFEKVLKNKTINYSYLDESKTHDYSMNWDFDNDSILDSLMFIGNDGANLRFNLFVKLSKNKKSYLFSSIYISMPLLEPISSLESEDISLFPKFVIGDFNKDNLDDIYINVDTSYSDWNKNFNNVILTYDKKDMDFIISEYKK